MLPKIVNDTSKHCDQRRLPYILYLTSLGLVKGPKQTLCAPYNISKRQMQAKNEKKVKIFSCVQKCLTKFCRPYKIQLQKSYYGILVFNYRFDAFGIEFHNGFFLN
ncbi:MAG: hypothetical protein J6X42_03755 [Alphaproteobacteria bacterium]|nr:hypothetical protein [Alphaproteobacteria bacterium]